MKECNFQLLSLKIQAGSGDVRCQGLLSGWPKRHILASSPLIAVADCFDSGMSIGIDN